MKKIRRRLQLGDWLILGLAGVIDFLEEIRDPLGIISNYYQTYFGTVPRRFRKSNLSHSLWRALKKGKVRRFIKKGRVIYSLSQKSKLEIERKYLLLLAKKRRWDRKWRFVIFDVEEKNRKGREFLRKRLKMMGFGMLQKSVWISPYDFLDRVKDLLKSSRLEKEVILIETNNLFVSDYIALAKKIWSIDELNNKYQELLQKINQIDYLKNKDDRRQKINEIKRKIVDIYLEDPHLPKVLLPRNWYGYQLLRRVKELNIF